MRKPITIKRQFTGKDESLGLIKLDNGIGLVSAEIWVNITKDANRSRKKSNCLSISGEVVHAARLFVFLVIAN